MNRFLYGVVSVYLFFLSFVSGFAYNLFFTISFAASLFFVIFYFFKFEKANKIGMGSPPYLFLFWLLFLTMFVVSSTGDKCFNQLMTWSYAFFVYNFCFRNILIIYFDEEKIKSRIVKVLAYGLLFTSLFVVFEFISKNIIGFPIDSYVPRRSLEEVNSGMILEGIRCRGFTEEPTQLGFYLMTIGPISLYWVWSYIKSKVIKIVMTSLVVMAVILSFSSAAYAVLVFSLLMYFSFFLKNNNFLVRILLVVVLLIVILNLNTDNFFAQTILSKFDADSLSGQDRQSRFEALRYCTGIHMLLGYGPAAYSTLGVESFISLIVDLLLNTGILGFILFAMFLLSVYSHINRVDDVFLQRSLKISFFNCCLYFIFGDVIYIPWFWITVTFAFVFSYYSNKRKRIRLITLNKQKDDKPIINRI